MKSRLLSKHKIITTAALILLAFGCGKKNSSRSNNNLGKGKPCTAQAKLLKTTVEINIPVSFGEDDNGQFVEYQENALSEKAIDQVMCRVEAKKSTPDMVYGFYFEYHAPNDKFTILGNNDAVFEFSRLDGQPGSLTGSWQLDGFIKHNEDKEVSVRPILIFSGDEFTHRLTCQKTVSACD